MASLHEVEIKQDSKVHYHKRMTEIYLVLEGEGHLELDGELVPVRPMTTVYIKPGCRHRAVGRLKIINIPVPAFDSEMNGLMRDAWFRLAAGLACRLNPSPREMRYQSI